MNSRLLSRYVPMCCLALGLAACGGGISGGGGGAGDVPQAEHDRVKAQLADANAALEAARTSLFNAQNALRGGAAPAARGQLRETLTEQSGALAAALTMLPEVSGEPETRTATREALASTKSALDALAGALAATGPSAGPTAADGHTALTRAENAIEAALADVAEAQGLLDDMPDAAAQAALTQAQNALLTAQLSVAPAIRAEIRADLATAQGRVTTLTAQLATATGNAAAFTRARDAALADVTRLTGELKTATDRAAALTTQLATANRNAATLTRERDAARADVTRLTGERDAARDRVTALTAELAAANGVVARLTAELATERANLAARTTERDENQAEIDRRKVVFGENIGATGANAHARRSNPAGSDVKRSWRIDPDGKVYEFHEGFDPRAGATAANRERQEFWDTTDTAAYTPETVSAVGYVDGRPSIIGDPENIATAPMGDEAGFVFPGRGTVFRGGIRATQAISSTGTQVNASNEGGYANDEGLIVQGQRDGTSKIRASDDTGDFKTWDAVPQTSFRYYSDTRGFTMSFGGSRSTAAGTAPDNAATPPTYSALIFRDLLAFPWRSAGESAANSTRDNSYARDVEISFGEPSPDPYGQRGYWWRMEVASALLDIERWKEGETGRPSGTNVGDPKLYYIADADGNDEPDTAVPDGDHKWMEADGSAQVENSANALAYVRLTDSPPDGEPGGAYEAFLSNYAGAGAGADEVPGTDDDVHRYLKYAAYGLFSWQDDNDKSELQGGADRYQTFHYGFDAFDADSDTATPALPATSMEAVFKGRTSGWILMPLSLDPTHGIDKLSHCWGTSLTAGDARQACTPNFIRSGLRMRADIALNACIGATNCTFEAGGDDDLNANNLSGTITGMEYSPGPGQGWTNRSTAAFRRLPLPTRGYNHNTPRPEESINGTFNLSAEIEPDGTYAGTVSPSSATDEPHTDGSNHVGWSMASWWQTGELEGAFYGPVDDLETAGTWWVPAQQFVETPVGIAGSFGAACTSGCEVPASN